MKLKQLLLSLMLCARSWGSIACAAVLLVATTATMDGKVITTNGSLVQVLAALATAVSGDTVLITGTATYGIAGAQIYIPAGVTLDGQGTAIVNMATSSPSGYGNALFTLGEGSVVRRLTLNGSDAYNCIPFRTNANDWRVSGITYNQFPGRDSYFIQVNGSVRGLI